jgi:glutathione synthase/RimK-type ligase-like ATP-grasp enzyme
VILLWGLSGERPIEAVRAALDEAGAPHLFLDQRDVLETGIEFSAGVTVEGTLRVGDRRLDLADVSAVYLRPYDSCRIPRIVRDGLGSASWRHAAAVDAAFIAWLEVADATLVNPFAAMATNESKPYQLERIRRLGFRTPDTLLTTDPAAARAFWEEHGEVIYKSVSGVRSKVARLRPDDLGRLDDVTSFPTQLQRYVEGTDHRVHVVGGEVYACEIRCPEDDYRYPVGEPAEIRPCQLDPEITTRCVALAADLGLHVAGIDLRRTPSGEWFGFEVNPSPAFTYYEEATGLPIARAVARFLVVAEGS